uniref:Uncharacterized protein n=1 Tax=Acrobeloides nanus TaxID=290746 RepID=A0A914DV11_9BILA
MSSPGIVIPVMVLLLLVIYFLFALVRGLKEANSDLSNQLMQDEDSPSKSLASLPRSNHKYFVPSLGSLNEVEDDDDDEDVSQRLLNEDEPAEPPESQPKLTWKEKFLICIGLEDPKRLRERASRRNTRQDTGEQMEMDEMIDEEALSSDSEDEDQNSEFVTDEQASSFVADEQDHFSDEHGDNENHHPRAPSRSPMRVNSMPTTRQGGQSDGEVNNKKRPHTLYIPQNNWLQPPSPRRAASSSLNKQPSTSSIDRDLASESSPLMEKQKKKPYESKLTPEKRSPLPPRSERTRQHPSIRNIIENDDELDSIQILIPSSSEAEPPPTVIDHAERLQVSDWGSHGQSTRPPSDERSFGDPTPSTSTIEQPELGLADPRIVYSNPYSSYASAMCSPIMQDAVSGRRNGAGYTPLLCQVAEVSPDKEKSSLTPTPQIQRRLVDPTLPPISPMSPRSRASDASSGNRTQSSGTGSHSDPRSPTSPSSPTEIGRPRFRISMSPTAARRTASEGNAQLNADPNARRFVLRVNGKTPPEAPGTPSSSGPRPAHRSHSQQQTTV